MPKASDSIVTILIFAALGELHRPIEKVKAVLEKPPWYAHQWQAKLQEAPVADHDLFLFNAGGEVG